MEQGVRHTEVFHPDSFSFLEGIVSNNQENKFIKCIKAK